MPDNGQDQKYTVTGRTENIELTKLGSAVKLRVFKQGKQFGTLRIGRGSLQWVSKGNHKSIAKKLSWGEVAKLFEESK